MSLLLGFKNYFYVGAICLGLGFLWGLLNEKARFDEFRGGVEALGKAQEKWSQDRNKQLQLAKQEVAKQHEKAIRNRERNHQLELERVRLDTSGSLLSGNTSSPAEPVQGEQCFDAAKLDAGIRGSVQRFLARVAVLVQRGQDSGEDLGFFGSWARQVGSCEAQ